MKMSAWYNRLVLGGYLGELAVVYMDCLKEMCCYVHMRACDWLQKCYTYLVDMQLPMYILKSILKKCHNAYAQMLGFLFIIYMVYPYIVCLFAM
jgi:hypothetical protein